MTGNGLIMNTEKTKMIVFGDRDWHKMMIIEGKEIENVKSFRLSSTGVSWMHFHNHGTWAVISVREAKALGKIWLSKSISLQRTLAYVLRTSVFSSMHVKLGCLQRIAAIKILVFERKYYRKVLRISWSGLTKLQKRVPVYNRLRTELNLLQTVIERRLQLFGHNGHI